jgi:hypothetical protein
MSNDDNNMLLNVALPANGGNPKGCVMCGMLPTKRCKRCMSARYCGLVCQRLAWPLHKSACFNMSGCPRGLTDDAQERHDERRRNRWIPKECVMCGNCPSFRCMRCKNARYCGTVCQGLAWATHRSDCHQMAGINLRGLVDMPGLAGALEEAN